MNSNCFVKRSAIPSVSSVGSYEYLSQEKVCINGRIVSRSIYLVDNPAERYKDLNPDDFFIENLVANGVELKSMVMTNSNLLALPKFMSRLDDLSNLQKSLSDES